jgi:hypothetical protein
VKGHITQTTLIKLLQDDLPIQKASSARQHINNCPACSAGLQALTLIISPSPDKMVKPGRSVLRKILAYHDSLTAPEHKQRFFYPRFAAAVVCTALACVFLFGVYSRKQYDHAPIHASKVKGVVKADTNILRKGQRVTPGVLLTTGENSKLAIFYGKIMKLIAGPHTRISVTKSHIDRKTGKIHFEMVIDKGTIIAVFDRGRKLEYTFITPHGRVSSTGSKIAMEVNPSKTRVAVKDGSANISSTHGFSVNTEEGSGYSIINNDVSSALEPSDEDEPDGETLYNKTLLDLLDDDDDDSSIQ